MSFCFLSSLRALCSLMARRRSSTCASLLLLLLFFFGCGEDHRDQQLAQEQNRPDEDRPHHSQYSISRVVLNNSREMESLLRSSHRLFSLLFASFALFACSLASLLFKETREYPIQGKIFRACFRGFILN